MAKGWKGVDLDGTLAKYSGFKGDEHIGEPVPAMLERVKRWLADGWEVRVMTARADKPKAVAAIKAWCKEHGLPALKVTNEKDKDMDELWDDRAIQVEMNTGRRMDGSHARLARRYPRQPHRHAHSIRATRSAHQAGSPARRSRSPRSSRPAGPRRPPRPRCGCPPRPGCRSALTTPCRRTTSCWCGGVS